MHKDYSLNCGINFYFDKLPNIVINLKQEKTINEKLIKKKLDQ